MAYTQAMNTTARTLMYLAAALLVVYFGVMSISEREGGAAEEPEAAQTTTPARYTPAPEVEQANYQLAEQQKDRSRVTAVGGCMATESKCQCYDTEGKPIDLDEKECKELLAVGPKNQ